MNWSLHRQIGSGGKDLKNEENTFSKRWPACWRSSIRAISGNVPPQQLRFPIARIWGESLRRSRLFPLSTQSDSWKGRQLGIITLPWWHIILELSGRTLSTLLQGPNCCFLDWCVFTWHMWHLRVHVWFPRIIMHVMETGYTRKMTCHLHIFDRGNYRVNTNRANMLRITIGSIHVW